MQHFDVGDLAVLRDSPLFDALWYVQNNPEVELLGIDPAEHYLTYGARLKRDPSERFDTAAYLAANPDVAERGANPLLHYIRLGKAEGREFPTRQQPSGNRNPAGPIPIDYAQQYLLIESAFDKEYYLRRYPDIAKAKIDPIKHFIEYGGKERRNPRPDFDSRYYTERYEDVRKSAVHPFLHYLVIGREEGRNPNPWSAGNSSFDRICGMLELAPGDVERELGTRRQDLRGRLLRGELKDMIVRASLLEPLIEHAWLAALMAEQPPFRSDQLMAQTAALYRLQEAAQWERARAVVAIPWIHVSGATRIAGHLAGALAALYGERELVVVRTETSEFQFPEWFPNGCRHIDFAGETAGLTPQARQQVLVEFLRSLRPESVFNVNCRTLWDLMETYGPALAETTNLYAYLFCSDKNVFGDWVGYPIRNFHRSFDLHTGVITDSHFLAEDLRERFMVPESQAHKLDVLETPVIELPPPVKAPKQAPVRRPSVYWSGRFDRQKRIDIVYAIARRMPDLDFRLWGEPVLDKEFNKLVKPENVILEGVYQRFSDLPLPDCDLWLYTSEWDGVPNVLIEVAVAGIPLVGSLAGGTGEILIEGLSYPIKDIERVDLYEAAIRKVLADPQGARRNAQLLREKVMTRRGVEVYANKVREILNRASHGAS